MAIINISLYFVEPQLKSEGLIYDLNSDKRVNDDISNQRIFDIRLNDDLIESQFNMAKSYADKYGITIASILKINNNEG